MYTMFKTFYKNNQNSINRHCVNFKLKYFTVFNKPEKNLMLRKEIMLNHCCNGVILKYMFYKSVQKTSKILNISGQQ